MHHDKLSGTNIPKMDENTDSKYIYNSLNMEKSQYILLK